MKIELKKESWENIISCLHKNSINSEGNFWAAIQSIENQLEESSVEHDK